MTYLPVPYVFANRHLPLPLSELDSDLSYISGKIVSVKDFGAVGDGATEDAAAFQDAVDSGAAIVMVPAGTYVISTAVNITETVRIVGCSIDFAHTGVAKCRIRSNSIANDFFQINADNCTIEGLDLNGTGTRAVSANNGCGIAVGTEQRTVLDAAITIGTNILTSATANFTAADIGKYVSVAGAYTNNQVPYITAVTDSQTVEVIFNADATVAGATAVIAKVVVGTTIRDVSGASQSVCVDFRNASNYLMENCVLNGFIATRTNSVSPDKGDSQFIGCQFSASTAVGGACISQLASGGLRIVNCKFLSCYDSISIYWVKGVSGGPLISNCSFENVTHYAITLEGDATKTLHGMVITGNWFNGSQRQINIGSTLPLDNFQITGNVFVNGSANTMMFIGALCDRFNITGNLFDGGNVAGATGISVAAGAVNGLIADNRILRVTTKVSNANASVFVNQYDEGTFTPVLTFAVPGDLVVTPTQAVGFWTQNGRRVQCKWSLVIPAGNFTHTTASGNLRIGGLPFTSANVAGRNNVSGNVVVQGITKVGYTQFTPFVGVNVNYCNIYASGSGAAFSVVGAADMPTGGAVTIYGSIEFDLS